MKIPVIGGGIIGLEMGTVYSTLGESVGMAAELFEGVCTDLPPQEQQ